MSLIKAGDMLRINGVHGFGLLKEIIYAAQSQSTIFMVEVYLFGEFKQAQIMPLCPADCTKYHAEKSSAKRVFAAPDEHELAYLEMAA